MLDCSTGHLSLATRTWLEARAPVEAPEVAVREAGFFLSSVAEPKGSLPADLSFVKRFARENGFDHILFDRDAEALDCLPWYEDGNLPDLGRITAPVLTGHLGPCLVGDQEISVVNHDRIPEGALTLPRGEEALPDSDYLLTEGSAWFTTGTASVRIHAAEEGIRVAIHSLGGEMDPAIAESFASWEEIDGGIEPPGFG